MNTEWTTYPDNLSELLSKYGDGTWYPMLKMLRMNKGDAWYNAREPYHRLMRLPIDRGPFADPFRVLKEYTILEIKSENAEDFDKIVDRLMKYVSRLW